MIRHIFRILAEIFWSDWQHVGILETDVIFLEGTYDSQVKYDAWIHCYESRWGSRKIKIATGKTGMLSIFRFMTKYDIRKGTLYQTEVLPWLQGRRNDKIPGYQKVKSNKWDFIKKLKGETPIVLNDDEK